MEHVTYLHETKANSFSIPLYIVHCVLPKCVMTYGEIFSSVYLQIFIKSQQITSSQDFNKFDEYDIALITNYHARTVRNTIKKLLLLNLIEKKKINNKQHYQPINHTLHHNEVWNFINSFEETILQNTNHNQESLREKFSKINQAALSIFNDISLPFNSVDVEQLHQKINYAELVYRGSSLFYLSFLIQQQLNLCESWISERDRATLVGCSQPTLSRYIDKYEKSNIIRKTKKRKYYVLELCESLFDDVYQIQSIEKKVVNKMHDEIICPICNKDCLSTTSFVAHLTKSKDIKHKVIAQFKQENDLDVPMLLKHIRKASIEAILSDLIVEESSEEEKKVDDKPTKKEVKSSTKEEEKKVDNKSTKKEVKSSTKEKKQTIKEKVLNTSVGEIDFNDLPEKKENAKTIVAYFYDNLVKGKSSNFAREAAQVKKALDNGLSVDVVKKVLEYMYKRGQIAIQNLPSAIKDYAIYEEYLKNVDKEGTDAFLLKRFYDGFGLSINMQGFIKEIAKIKASIVTEGYENTKYIIDYMVQKKTTNIHYISAMRLEALENKKKNPNNKPNTTNKSSIDSNPAFRDQDDMVFIQSSLLSADKKISDVPKECSDELIAFAKQALIQSSISAKFSGFEWAWRVGLELDEETYLACEKLERQTLFDRGINMYLSQNKMDMYQKVLKKKKKFDDWLQKQHDLFGFCKQQLN